MAFVAAALAVAAAGAVALPAPPSAAAVCSDATGVSVVVDYNSLGGGVSSVCDPDGGGSSASQLFPAAGFPLTYAQRSPGFVCRVSGKPASDPCVNAAPEDAFWSLWWTDGTSGTWSYSTLGASSLKIPAGGSVAWSWDDQDGRQPPSIAAPKTAAEPEPTPSPSPQPTPSEQPSSSGNANGTSGGSSSGSGSSGAGGSKGGSGSSGSGSSADSPSPSGTGTSGGGDATDETSAPSAIESDGSDEGEGKQKRKRKQAEDDASPEIANDPSDPSAGAAEDSTDSIDSEAAVSSSGGLPTWLVGLVAGLVLAGAGGLVWWRRRSTPQASPTA